MNGYQERILDLALEEVLGKTSPPDLSRRILAAANGPRKAGHPFLKGWAAGLAASLAIATGVWVLRTPEPPAWRIAGARASSDWIVAERPVTLERAGRIVARLETGRVRVVAVDRLELPEGCLSLLAVAGSHCEIGTPTGTVSTDGAELVVWVAKPEGGPKMDRKFWTGTGLGIATTVVVMSGVAQYRGDANGAAVTVNAGEQLDVDRQGAARMSALKAREEAVAQREKALADREAALAGDRKALEVAADRQEKALAEREAALRASPAQPETPKALTEEEKKRQAVLDGATRLGSLFKRMDGLDPEKMTEGEALGIGAELMNALADLNKTPITGVLAADAIVATFDAAMPEGLGATEEQRARFSALYLDMERQQEMLGLPKRFLFALPMGKKEPLTPEKEAQQAQIRTTFTQGVVNLFTPSQNEHLGPKGAEGIRALLDEGVEGAMGD